MFRPVKIKLKVVKKCSIKDKLYVVIMSCTRFRVNPHSIFHNLYPHSTLYVAPVSSKEFLDIQAHKECGFTLKRVRDMIRTYS